VASTNITSLTTGVTCREGPGAGVQSSLSMRAGASATQGRIWPGPLRGQILAGTAPSCYVDHDRIWLFAAPTPSQCFTSRKKPTSNVLGLRPEPSLPAVRRAIIASLHSMIYVRCPHCGGTICLHQRECLGRVVLGDQEKTLRAGSVEVR
jgi:hypothetical protein